MFGLRSLRSGVLRQHHIGSKKAHALFRTWAMLTVRCVVQIGTGPISHVALDQFTAHNKDRFTTGTVLVRARPLVTRQDVDDPSTDPRPARKIRASASGTNDSSGNAVEIERLARGGVT